MNQRLGKISLTMIAILAALGVAFLVMTNRLSLAHEGEVHEDPFKTVPADTRDCMKKIFGETRFEEMTKGSAFTPEEQKLLESSGCFSQTSTVGEVQVEPIKDNPFGGLADETRSCIIEIIGQEGYDKLARGGSFEEYKHALENSGCFGKKTALGGEQIVPIKTNPFGDMHPSMVECLTGAFGEARFEELKNGAGFTNQDKQKVEGAGCFKGESKYKGDDKPEGANPAVEDCVKRIIGEERLNGLRSSGTPPTPGEMEKMKTCFSQDKKYLPNPVYAREGLPADVDKCMRLALSDRYEDIKRGLVAITEEDRQAGYKCIGKADDPIAPPPEVKMPETLEKCLKDAVGEDRFKAISGGEEPTDEERTKGEECFKEHDQKTQPKTVKSDQILPPPAKQVPFIKEDPSSIRVDDVTVKDGIFNIHGQTTQGTDQVVVDVYIYSEAPVQVTATADKSGQWTLAYDGQLTDGSHKIYAVVKKAGENVRSAAEKFVAGVAQAQTLNTNTPSQTTRPTTTPVQPTRRILDYVVYVVGGSLVAVLLGLLIYLVIKKRSPAPPGRSS